MGKRSEKGGNEVTGKKFNFGRIIDEE